MTPIQENLLWILVFLIIMLIVLSGCSRPFIKDTDHEVVLIEWYKKDRNVESAQDACSSHKRDGVKIVGCARWHYDSLANMQRCRIFAPDVDSLYSQEADTFTEEVLHCFKGRFHE